MDDSDSTAGRMAVAPPPETRPPKVRSRPASAMLEPSILRRALVEALVKLDPRHMIHTPVMFVVEIGSIVTTVYFFAHRGLFVGSIMVWLWAAVLFANFAEAVAEGRGKAQADTLSRGRQETAASFCGPTARWTRSLQRNCGPGTCAWSQPVRSSPATGT